MLTSLTQEAQPGDELPLGFVSRILWSRPGLVF